MNRRTFIRIVGGGVVFSATAGLTACKVEMPPEAIAAWQGPQPGTDVRKWILSYAILAPHSHNLQSWLVDLSAPNEIILYCDLTRLLPETDPYYRQIMMSHGTFLELVDIAAEAWRIELTTPAKILETYRLLRVWTRLGYGPQIEPAPRRGLEAHITKS